MNCHECKHYKEYYEGLTIIENKCKLSGMCYFTRYWQNDCPFVNKDGSLNKKNLDKL